MTTKSMHQSPSDAQQAPPEEYLYVAGMRVGTWADKPDFLAVVDTRPGSETHGQIEQFFFTPATAGLLKIPPGVWHADQNWGETEARIMNFPTRPYDHEHPDKFRIDPHSGMIPFEWQLRDG